MQAYKLKVHLGRETICYLKTSYKNNFLLPKQFPRKIIYLREYLNI
jgi:hypothetical protein